MTTTEPGSGLAAPALPPPERPTRTVWARRVAFGIAIALAGGAAVHLRRTMGKETTDDAHLEADTVDPTAMVAGRIASILVADDALVEPGAVLATLEDEMYRLAVARSDAEVAAQTAVVRQAEARRRSADDHGKLGVVAARGEELGASAARRALDADLSEARAQLTAVRAQKDLAEHDYARAQALGNTLAASQLEAQRVAVERARAELGRAEARLASAEARGAATDSARIVAHEHSRIASLGDVVDQAVADVALATARLEQATASRELARADLERTKVTAPFRGRVRLHVGRGAFAAVGTPIATLVSTERVWVTARFKEKQVARIAAGQHATIVIDAFEPKVFDAKVESLAGATASRFAGAPLEGTSTRFVRVSQRVPVRLLLDTIPPRAYAGLNAVVTVDVTSAAP